MRREELPELQYIIPMANVPSVLRHGILSHSGAARISHQTAALEVIQERRQSKQVPGGRPLHDYVNLYICARNPMLFLRQANHDQLCVLRVSTHVLDLPGVVVADRNASSDYVRFGPAPDALALIDTALAFAEFWTHPGDQIQEWRHKSIKCAEVLVPDRVDAGDIQGAWVSCAGAKARLSGLAPDLAAAVNPHLFFL